MQDCLFWRWTTLLVEDNIFSGRQQFQQKTTFSADDKNFGGIQHFLQKTTFWHVSITSINQPCQSTVSITHFDRPSQSPMLITQLIWVAVE
jgi:hypothetical protein